MKTISLAKAFRIRNKLKEKISKFTMDWSYVTKSYKEGETPSYKRTNGFDARGVLYGVDFLNIVLLLLNEAINEANKGRAQSINLQLNSINDRLRFLEMAIETIYQQPDEYIEENRITGVKTVTKAIHTFNDPSEVEMLVKNLRDQKFMLETELSEVNGSTEVDVSAPCPTGNGEPLGEILKRELGSIL